MVCDAVQHNQTEPTGGNSGLRPFCIATPVGFFIGDKAMKQIPLTQGQFALVDDEDYKELSKFKWCVLKAKNTFYAMRSSPCDPVTHKQRAILMHREIMNTPVGMETDHRDGNGLENRRFNLRNCSRVENLRNQRKLSNCSSRFKGVCRHKRGREWRAQIQINGKKLHLGYFNNETDAARAYDKAAIKYFGEFAHTNGGK